MLAFETFMASIPMRLVPRIEAAIEPAVQVLADPAATTAQGEAIGGLQRFFQMREGAADEAERARRREEVLRRIEAARMPQAAPVAVAAQPAVAAAAAPVAAAQPAIVPGMIRAVAAAARAAP